MDVAANYLVVEASILPQVFLKVIEAQRMLKSGQVTSINEAAKRAGISRSAYYKYKDKIHSFAGGKQGRLITFRAMLLDEVGALSAFTAMLFSSGANILTINQSIPIGGMAAVSVTARVEGMNISGAELMMKLRLVEGVESVELLQSE